MTEEIDDKPSLGIDQGEHNAAEHMIGAFRANGGEAVAVMSTNADRAVSYAKKHGIAHVTTSLKELVDSRDVDAVYDQ